MKQIGLSIGELQGRYGNECSLEICAESGFDAVDISLKPLDTVYSQGDDATIEYCTRLGERARALGLTVSQTHGRTRIATPDPAFCEQMEQITRMDLLATKALGAPYCVIHSVNSASFPDGDADFMHARNLRFFEAMIPYAEQYGVYLTQETFGDSRVSGVRRLDFFGDARELRKTYDRLNTENKALCMDTGHTNKAHAIGQLLGTPVPDVADTIRLLGKDLKVLHLNDNNSFTDQHLAPACKMEGNVNWTEVYEALEEIGYCGVYNFELALNVYGDAMKEAVRFLGYYLRRSAEGSL